MSQMTAGEIAATPGQGRKLALYTLAIFAVMLVTSLYHLRTTGIFACPATGYAGDHYLAYCHADGYADIDHGSFWYALDPVSQDSARKADVLFLGNSRLEFGLSSPATTQWFADNKLSYYLLGFSYTENVQFTKPLLGRIKPQARAYVINLDQFFSSDVTPPAREVMFAGDGLTRQRSKMSWQEPHRQVCSWLPFICGDLQAYYRERTTGQWILKGTIGDAGKPLSGSDIGPDQRVNFKAMVSEQAAAKDFIASLGVPHDCVILSYVPTRENQRPRAEALAGALGYPLVSPKLDGLRTFDGSHLDPASAELFSTAFMAEAGPLLQACLQEPAQ
ncbi:MAG: hypothetical protein U1E34_09230 [Amaricoccus sp.]